MSEIRRLRISDLPALLCLSNAAGWNQTPADWRRILLLEPWGCFGVEVDHSIVATATAVCYGRRLAWIGMVLTHPHHRRKGYARKLMEHVLAHLHRCRIEWFKLDATELGRPLYSRLGFRTEDTIERWVGVAPESLQPSGPEGFTPVPDLDLEAFGADRSRLLKELSLFEAASIPGEGFVMGRPGARAWTCGPCIARSPEAARALISWFLSRHPGEAVYWDLLPGNLEAVRLAEEFGFEPRRKLLRMVRRGQAFAKPLEIDNSLVYAAAGFEYG